MASNPVLESGRNLLSFGQAVLSLAAQQTSVFLDRSTALAAPLRGIKLISLPRSCEFPEPCKCSSVAHLVREGFRGELLLEPIVVWNETAEKAHFKCEPSALTGPGGAKGPTPTVDPPEIDVDPHTSGVFRLRIPLEVERAGRYQGIVRIAGPCEHIISVVIHIGEVESGQVVIVQRKCSPCRPHHWQDHFYCEPRKK